jgi:ATP adenylyltransferase
VSLDHLWAGWRSPYIEAASGPAETSPLRGRDGQSLFEAILDSGRPDEETFIVHRGGSCFVILNAYPYTSGHLLVLPNRRVATLPELTDEESTELWALTRSSVAAVTAAYSCDGVNVGMNLGAAGGAGVPDHLHMHVLPRWAGDTNFMTAVAETRVMPETLSTSWRKLRDAWPARSA